MPPKIDLPKPYFWAKGNGKLTEVTRGIIFGMHLSGKSVAAIAALMDVTVKTVRTTIRSMNEHVTGVKPAEGPEGLDAFETDGAAEDPPTRASSICQQAIEDRQQFVDSLIYERNEDDRFAVNCARDIRKRLRENSLPLVSLRTLQRDLKVLGHRWKSKPVVCAMKPHHKERRLELGQQLLQHDLNNLLFSDESYFRTTDAHKHSAYQRRGMDQEPRPQERYVSSVLVWGCIGIGFSLLVILNETVNKERYVQMQKRFCSQCWKSATSSCKTTLAPTRQSTPKMP